VEATTPPPVTSTNEDAVKDKGDSPELKARMEVTRARSEASGRAAAGARLVGLRRHGSKESRKIQEQKTGRKINQLSTLCTIRIQTDTLHNVANNRLRSTKDEAAGPPINRRHVRHLHTCRLRGPPATPRHTPGNVTNRHCPPMQ